MRITLCSILVILSACSFGQRVQGTYHPNAKTSESWSINEHATLVWNGQPYLPTGSIVDSPSAIERADAVGIKDFVLDLPASGLGWNEAFSSLESHRSRYVLRINSLAPMAQGVAVEPQGYRFPGIVTKRTIHASLPGVKSAFVVLALRRDGSIVRTARVQVVDGQLDFPVDAPGGGEHVLLVYPILTSAQQPDYWDGLDQHRDRLLESFRRHAPGEGLRGIINPFGRTLVLPGKELRFVPTSPYFRIELRNLLLDHYKNLETAQKVWSLVSNGISGFDVMSRLVPLWSGTRGVSALWDPETDKVYPCDNRRSSIWSDINEVVTTAAARRYSRIVSDIHSIVDVPVIQEWTGWSATYETSEPSIDGIGMRTVGTAPSSLLDLAGRAASSAFRWKRVGWFPATDIDLGPAGDPAQLGAVLDDLTAIGARGYFIRADSPATLKAVGALSSRTPPAGIQDESPRVLYYPENALNPAQTQRLPGGTWWLPSPMDGERVDLGSMYLAYRYSADGKKTFAIWAKKPGKVKLLLSKPKTAIFTTLDGSDPKPKLLKDGVELMLSDMPTIVTGTDEIPLPEPALNETLGNLAQLAAVMEKNHQDAPEELYIVRDEFPLLKENPGAAFTKIREAYRSLSLRIGRFSWIEAESSKDTNFSESDQLASCSGGQALALRTSMPPDDQGYYARYNLLVRSTVDQEVWIAARIPADRRGDVQVTIGGQQNGEVAGQTLTISTEPVSLYGQGFGWYKLGVTRLAGTSTNLTVTVTGQTASDMAIDVIALTPGNFTPNGVTVPEPMVFADVSKKPAKKGSRSGG